MIRTPTWPASWKARIRWSGIARPTWMSGEVTSIPSFTRSGRPSRSFSSSPPRAGGARRSVRGLRRRRRRSRGPIVPTRRLRTDTAPGSTQRRRTTGRTRGSRRRAEARQRSVEPATVRYGEQRAEPGRDDRHRDRGEEREDDERERAPRRRDGIAASSRTPTPALPPMPWTSPIPNAPAGERTGCR